MFDAIVFSAFGLIVGSFLNVLILRWGARPLTGRSVCETCGRVLAWYDLVPVLSWLVLRGRCRSCGSRISIQYPLVEAGTALLFVLIALAPLPLSARIFALPIAALLVAILVYDLYHTIIPDPWVYAFALLALATALLPFYVSALDLSSAIVEIFMFIAAGPIVAFPLFALWFVSKGTWMGFGDVKLALGMGWLLGPFFGIVALFLAFIIGGIVSAPLLFFSSSLWERIQKRFTPIASSPKAAWGFTMKSEIPFGPFLIAATFIIWLLNMYGFALGNLFV